MKDVNIQWITAEFVDEIFRGFKLENNTPPLHILCLRYLGKIRKPPRRTSYTKK